MPHDSREMKGRPKCPLLRWTALIFERGCARRGVLLAVVFVLLAVVGARPVMRHGETPGAAALANVGATVRQRRRRQEGKGWNDTGCMSLFMKKRAEFEVCREATCFLFLQEEPYIILDPGMDSEEHEYIFNCSNIPKQFRLLRGTSFLIMARTSANNGMCAWAGKSCGFNHLVEFIASQSTVSRPYRFAIMGLLLEFQDRVGPHLVPTVSLLQEQLAVIGPRAIQTDPFPYNRLIRPFQMGAWTMFIATIVICALFSAGMAVVFGPRPLSLYSVFSFHFGNYDEPDVALTTAAPGPPNTEGNSTNENASSGNVLQRTLTRLVTYRRQPVMGESGTAEQMGQEAVEKLWNKEFFSRVTNQLSSYRVARRLLQIALSATAIVFLIFYEIAVVNFLFIEQSQPRIQSVQKLSKSDLAKYTIQKNAATESVWHRTVDPKGLYNESNYPWYRCRAETECFEWILDPTHPAELFVGFKTIGTYQVTSRGICKNMTVYDTDQQLYTFGAGWLYNGAVTEEYRREIDVQILDLLVADELGKIVDDDIGTLNLLACTPVINDIDVYIIGTSILVFVSPFLLLSLAILLFYGYNKVMKTGRNAHGQPRRWSRQISRSQIAELCHSRLGSIMRRRTRCTPSVPPTGTPAHAVPTADIGTAEEGSGN